MKGDQKIVITGSSGLIGSEAVTFFDSQGWQVLGIDNNMRQTFFGAAGSTTAVRDRLLQFTSRFKHFDLDIRNREQVLEFFATHRPDAIIHCAAQPSHDLAKDIPFEDFDTNAVGTINLLEATRRFVKESPFAFMSTNKVYGSRPNELPLKEFPTRYDYARPEDFLGITENMSIDQTLHSLFGASKVAADIATQEYGKYFKMPTAIFRGGCLTGPQHSGVQLHGFLSYLVKTAVKKQEYTIIGYRGKQVRDQIHSADVISAFHQFILKPRCGEVYNLGGGRDSNCSVLEAISAIENLTGNKLAVKYDDNVRIGDHVCYISDLSKLSADYPGWKLTKTFPTIVEEMVRNEQSTTNK